MKLVFVGVSGVLVGLIWIGLTIRKHFPFREAAPPLKQLLKDHPRDRMWT